MSVLASLVRRYEQLAARHQAPPLGYSNEKIAFGIVIDCKGTVIDVMALGIIEKNRHWPAIMSVHSRLPQRWRNG